MGVSSLVPLSLEVPGLFWVFFRLGTYLIWNLQVSFLIPLSPFLVSWRLWYPASYVKTSGCTCPVLLPIVSVFTIFFCLSSVAGDRDNRNLNDDGSSQGLDSDDIERLKAQGVKDQVRGVVPGTVIRLVHSVFGLQRLPYLAAIWHRHVIHPSLVGAALCFSMVPTACWMLRIHSFCMAGCEGILKRSSFCVLFLSTGLGRSSGCSQQDLWWKDALRQGQVLEEERGQVSDTTISMYLYM